MFTPMRNSWSPEAVSGPLPAMRNNFGQVAPSGGLPRAQSPAGPLPTPYPVQNNAPQPQPAAPMPQPAAPIAGMQQAPAPMPQPMPPPGSHISSFQQPGIRSGNTGIVPPAMQHSMGAGVQQPMGQPMGALNASNLQGQLANWFRSQAPLWNNAQQQATQQYNPQMAQMTPELQQQAVQGFNQQSPLGALSRFASVPNGMNYLQRY